MTLERNVFELLKQEIESMNTRFRVKACIYYSLYLLPTDENQ